VAGRTAAAGAAAYNATKWAVVAFSEAMRQEVLNFDVRVTVIEPGFVDTELQGHNELPAVVESIEKNKERIGKVLTSEDIANAIVYAVNQPPHVSINEVLVRPTRQRA
jgi:NADP-dependent 3-hydroxy acid dehydrogenase YdfG